ncbi:MAG: hypothetical protein HY718_09325 [Planctomycetes bacterium]|nr:hypothetical protein [Planctomycetota bacterium]
MRRATTRRTERALGVMVGCGIALAMACEKQRVAGPSTSVADDGTATAPDEPIEPMTPRSADSRDDPAAPRALPRSSEVQDWIKTEPVRVAPAGQMKSLVDDEELARVLGAFHVERVARCAYQSPYATAQAVLVEASTPTDALGAYSILVPHAGCTARDDGSLLASAKRENQLVVSACQGRVLLQLYCVLGDEEAGAKSCERLAGRTVFSVPAADPPLLAQAVRDVNPEQCDLWLVRTAALLRGLDHPTLRRLNGAELNARLGLTGEAVLSIVSVRQTRESAPLVIWLAEYPTDDAAKAANERYRQAIKDATGGLDQTTLLGSPRGRYLVGTWTAEQETARNLVRMLEQVLAQR